MRALLISEFAQTPAIETVADPSPNAHGVVIEVAATGVCRSDWHAWMGHDGDVNLPHVPGHEMAGTIVEVGSDVKEWRQGDRVTLPFVCACGSCPQCHSGNQQVCDAQFQPGFTHWGSFAELVAIDYAEENLVRLPESIDFVTAASLGCRFVTSYRAVVDQGQLTPGQWVAVHGCGGVGLSAIMIASALGAKVIGVDLTEEKLTKARAIGAETVINANDTEDVGAAIRDMTDGGVQISIDALGSTQTSINSIMSLAKRGKHIQVGLMFGEHSTPEIPMARVIANELEIIGSHGIQAYKYPAIFDLIHQGKLAPEELVGSTISLNQSIDALVNMDQFGSVGVTVIDRFDPTGHSGLSN